MDDGSFKALADPTRRKILRMLNERELSAGEIASEFSISGPSMSHHFSILRQADLITARKHGQQIYYSLNTTVMQDLLTVILDLLTPNPTTQENEN